MGEKAKRKMSVEVSDLVFTPSRVKDLTISHIDHLRSNDSPGLSIGIERVDEKLIPPRAGELVVILARPGQGKSSLISHYE